MIWVRVSHSRVPCSTNRLRNFTGTTSPGRYIPYFSLLALFVASLVCLIGYLTPPKAGHAKLGYAVLCQRNAYRENSFNGVCQMGAACQYHCMADCLFIDGQLAEQLAYRIGISSYILFFQDCLPDNCIIYKVYQAVKAAVTCGCLEI